MFRPFVMETTGALGTQALSFINELRQITTEKFSAYAGRDPSKMTQDLDVDINMAVVKHIGMELMRRARFNTANPALSEAAMVDIDMRRARANRFFKLLTSGKVKVDYPTAGNCDHSEISSQPQYGRCSIPSFEMSDVCIDCNDGGGGDEAANTTDPPPTNTSSTKPNTTRAPTSQRENSATTSDARCSGGTDGADSQMTTFPDTSRPMRIAQVPTPSAHRQTPQPLPHPPSPSTTTTTTYYAKFQKVQKVQNAQVISIPHIPFTNNISNIHSNNFSNIGSNYGNRFPNISNTGYNKSPPILHSKPIQPDAHLHTKLWQSPLPANLPS